MSEGDATADGKSQPEPESTETSALPVRPVISLQSLAPHFNAEQHGVYVDALEQGLRTPGVRNIALTGPYGTGKSSVLAKLSDQHPTRVIELSLSSVGEEPAAAGEKTDPSSTRTNRIQKEIVKQILYRDPPSRTRGSRFRRLAPLRFWREAPVALIGGLLLLGVLFLTGVSRPLVEVGDGKPVPLAVAYLTLWLVLAVGWLLARYGTYGRLSLEKLTAGPATVSLIGQPTSYFDQYIDEIVFSFEQTGRDVVIFEDLDRFRDVHIFESLRALNTLLNSAAQVQQRRRQERPSRWRRLQHSATSSAPWPRDVVFIYALRDSVFERLGGANDDSGTKENEETTPKFPQPEVATIDAAQEEVQLANRTKFFDLVVPVVPFITHRNARELMKTQMQGTDVSLSLISLAAQHVAEQRLIIDLRNEFDIYADRLLHVKTPMPGLSADKLFAMLLYKSVHLADFEQIRFRRSRLDQLWDAWRELVATGIDNATEQDLRAAAALTREQSLAAHARMLASRVDELACVLLGANSRTNYSVETPGGWAPSDVLRTAEFWQQLMANRRQLAIRPGGRGPTGWPHDAIGAVLDRPLEADRWLPTHREEENRRRESAQENLHFLAHHTWKQIYERVDFRLPGVAGDAETFQQLTGRLLQSRLAQELVAAGYIDEYFALWVSMFYGQVASAAALDFMVHVLDPGVARMDYPLSAADVDMVLVDRGFEVAGDRAAYNIAVLDRLLATGNDAIELMLRRIEQWDEKDVSFVTRYLRRGADPAELVRRLAPRVNGLTSFVLSAAPPERRASLVDAALAASTGPQLQPGDEVAEYVLERYTDFPSLISAGWPARRTSAIARIVDGGLTLPDVTMTTPAVLQQLARSGGYTATEANLQAVSGGAVIALDVLRGEAPSVADLAVEQLPTYLEAVRASGGRQVTVQQPAAFAMTLAFVADAASEDVLIERTVRLASGGCGVNELTQAPQAAWRELLTSARTMPTAGNLSAWVEHVGALGPVQSALTKDTELIGVQQLEQSQRTELAVALLATSLPVQQRVRLADALHLEDQLPVERIAAEPGPLAGLLLRADLVEDDEATFRRLVVDWPGREAAITASQQFGVFVSPTVLPVAELAAFFGSNQVTDPVKQQVLDDIDAWLTVRSPAAADGATAWAARAHSTPTSRVLQILTAAGAQRTMLVRLLSAQPAMPEEEFRAVLRSMGGDYALVADPGRKSPSFPADAAHRTVLERLQAAGLVGQIKPVDGRLRVWSRPSTDR